MKNVHAQSRRERHVPDVQRDGFACQPRHAGVHVQSRRVVGKRVDASSHAQRGVIGPVLAAGPDVSIDPDIPVDPIGGGATCLTV